MKIGIIGTGNVAQIMADLISSGGHQLVQILGRSKEKAAVLAQKYECSFDDLSGKPDPFVDIFIIAISDDALRSQSIQISLPHSIVLHTAGSVSKDVLKDFSEKIGVIYPLQTLQSPLTCTSPIPLLIDGNHEDVLKHIRELATSISSVVHVAGDEERRKAHLAAVIVNNFSNHLFSLAERYCQSEGIDFSWLLPLIQETAKRLEQSSPGEIQTGPARRHDLQTIQAHLAMLEPFPELKKIYELFTSGIIQQYPGYL